MPYGSYDMPYETYDMLYAISKSLTESSIGLGSTSFIWNVLNSFHQ